MGGTSAAYLVHMLLWQAGHSACPSCMFCPRSSRVAQLGRGQYTRSLTAMLALATISMVDYPSESDPL